MNCRTVFFSVFFFQSVSLYNCRAAVDGDETALDTLTNWRPRTAARNQSYSSVKDNHCFYAGTESGVIYYINQSGMCTEVLRSNVSTFVQILWRPKRYLKRMDDILFVRI